MRKKICKLLCVLMLFLTGCGNNVPSEYELGIIDTTEYGNKSKFTFLDNSWNEVGQTRYRYSNMSYCGFFNSFVQDNMLYLLPKGISQKLDCGKVVAFDLSSGHKKEYDFGRTNITDFYVDDFAVYIVSNLNGVSYIDRCEKRTNEIQTIQLKEDILYNVIIINEKPYSISIDMDTDSYALYCFDFGSRNYKKVYDLDISTAPAFMETYHDNIYFPIDSTLYVYDTASNSMEEIELPHQNAFNLNRQDNILYIGCTDIYTDTTSYIISMNLDTEEIKEVMTYNGSILQMEIDKNNDWFIMDYQKLSQFRIHGSEQPILVNTMDLNPPKNYYSGGFFLRNNK